jgi:hypothetical protein
MIGQDANLRGAKDDLNLAKGDAKLSKIPYQ